MTPDLFEISIPEQQKAPIDFQLLQLKSQFSISVSGSGQRCLVLIKSDPGKKKKNWPSQSLILQ